MKARLIVAIAAAALAGAAQAQTAGDTAKEAARDTGAAAKAAVTPGDQNMGRTPNNRSGGLMGNDQPAGAAGRAAEAAVTPGDQNMGRNPGQPQRRSHGRRPHPDGHRAEQRSPPPARGSQLTSRRELCECDGSAVGSHSCHPSHRARRREASRPASVP